MQFGFNTGRLYTHDGQRISVKILDDHSVLFNDHSRGIDGKLRVKISPDLPRWRIIETVMHHYDRNQYDWDSAADAVRADEFIQHTC